MNSVDSVATAENSIQPLPSLGVIKNPDSEQPVRESQVNKIPRAPSRGTQNEMKLNKTPEQLQYMMDSKMNSARQRINNTSKFE